MGNCSNGWFFLAKANACYLPPVARFGLFLCVCVFFPQIAFAIGVLTSSLRVGDRGISRLFAGGGCHLGCHRWCLITDVPGRCWAGCR